MVNQKLKTKYKKLLNAANKMKQALNDIKTIGIRVTPSGKDVLNYSASLANKAITDFNHFIESIEKN